MKVFVFEPFKLDLARYELARGEEALPLPRVAMEILILLLNREGRLLTRQDIVSALWAGSDPADVAQSITTAINRLRSTLGDDSAKPRYIQTVIGKGYRFIAPVEVIQLPEAEPARVQPAANGIADVATDQPIPDQPAPLLKRTSPPSWQWAMLLCVAIAALVFVLHSRAHSRDNATAQSADSTGLPATRFTAKASEDRVTAAAISPDGRLIAYADADGVALQGRDTADSHSLRAPALAEVNRLAWFPDAIHLLLSGTSASATPELWLISVVGDEPVRLREDARRGVPSPDGSLIVFTAANDSEVWVMGHAGDGARQIVGGKSGDIFPTVLWSANSHSLLLQRRSLDIKNEQPVANSAEIPYGYHAAYLAADIETGHVTALEDGIRFGAACLLSDSQLLFTRNEPNEYETSTSFWKVKLDPVTGAFVSRPQRVDTMSNFHVVTLSAAAGKDEIAAVLQQGQPVVYVGSLHSSGPTLDNVRRLSLDASISYPHAWSPDSSSVLYESMWQGQWHIFEQRLDRHDPRSLLEIQGDQALPRISPDKRFLLFASRPGPNAEYELFREPLQGGTPAHIDTGAALDEYRCPLAGKFCVLRTMTENQSFHFLALDPIVGKSTELFTAPWAWAASGDWDISPDGARLALISSLSASPLIHVVTVATGQTQDVAVAIASHLISVNWDSGGKGWFVAASTPTGNDLFYVSMSGQTKLLRRTSSSTWAVPSPDGRKLAFVDQNVDSNVWLLRAGGSHTIAGGTNPPTRALALSF